MNYGVLLGLSVFLSLRQKCATISPCSHSLPDVGQDPRLLFWFSGIPSSPSSPTPHMAADTHTGLNRMAFFPFLLHPLFWAVAEISNLPALEFSFNFNIIFKIKLSKFYFKTRKKGKDAEV